MDKVMRSPLFLPSLFIAMFLTAFTLFATITDANPAQFTTTTQTATATTSPAYLPAGTATSTLVHDTFQSSTGNNYVNSMTELLVQFTASSTLSVLNINLEYSNGYPGVDCVTTPNACDWYQDTPTNMNGFATTTQSMSLSLVPQYQWKFASSTVGQQMPSASSTRDTRALSINVPTRYVRAIFTCLSTGTSCTVWGQFVPAKETK